MRRLLYIFILCQALLKAQDKLYLNNGTSRTGIIVSISKESVFFKVSDTSVVQRIKKADIIMAENYKGTRYIFGNEQSEHEKEKKKKGAVATVAPPGKGRNYLGIQPLAFLFGRATLIYERFNDNGNIGVAFPLSLTYNPYPATGNTNSTLIQGTQKKDGTNFIGGIDVNFYLGETGRYRFFAGPRARYGTDMLLFNTEAYTLQTQVGWKLERPDNHFVQHISIGFGFVRILSTTGITTNSRQLFGWYSFNYRFGVRW